MTSSVPHEEGTRPFGKHNDDCGSCCCRSVDTDHLRAEVSRLTTERDEARQVIEPARELLRVMANLPIFLPRQGGKTAVHDAWHALSLAVDAARQPDHEGPATPTAPTQRDQL